MKEATVIQTAGGTFYIHDLEQGLTLRAFARGRLKKGGERIYPGDRVIYRDDKGSTIIEEILPRQNLLKKPKVSNVDELIIVKSVEEPAPDFYYLDKMLALAQWFQISALICVNKIDLDGQTGKIIKQIYEPLNYEVVLTSAVENEGVDLLLETVTGKIAVLLGPSGVGKSTILNCLNPSWDLPVGGISEKLGRGKHTTKHTRLLPWEKGFITDTPGFSQLNVNLIPLKILPHTFVEFSKFADGCRFSGCFHHKEPDCVVKENVETGEICRQRFDNYIRLLKEIKENG